MKFIYVTLSLFTLCLISCKKEVKADTETVGADSIKTEETAVKPLDSAAEMKAWTEYANPGNSHKMMAEETGTWNCDMSFWM